MAGKWEGRILLGGLAWQTNDRSLGDAFCRFRRVVNAQVIVNRETGASRGFGFVTFESQRAVDNAIREMHYQELDGWIIEVYNAETSMNTRRNAGDTRYGRDGGGRGHYRGGRGDAPRPGNCFACGRPGHWARDCHSAGGRHSGGVSLKFSGGGRGSGFSGSHKFEYRYMNNGHSGGHNGHGDHINNRERYVGCPDRSAKSQLFPSGGDRFGADRYGGGTDGYSQTGYNRAQGRSCHAQTGGYHRPRGRSCDEQRGGYHRARGRSCDAQSGGHSRSRGRSSDAQSGRYRRVRGRSSDAQSGS